MFMLRKINVPELYANCASCGCYGNDMRILNVFQTVMVGGREYRITTQVPSIYLCKDCREKLKELLEASAEEDHEGQKEERTE